MRDKYNELKAFIEKCNNAYYNEDNPIISDFEYDKLLKDLQIIENAHPDFLEETSPTQIVGGKAISRFNKISHKVPMLSLSNTYNMNDIMEFDERVRNILINQSNDIEYILELKLDGMSISLIYEKGIFKKAITRGDGKVGEDVTDTVKEIESIPKKLNKDVDIEVRGEIVLPISNFKY